MSENACQVSRVIAIEEHAWNPGLREALLKFGGDDTKRVLLSLLDNVTFGESAAFELIRFGTAKPQEKGFRTGPSFEQIVPSRAAPATKLNAVAAAAHSPAKSVSSADGRSRRVIGVISKA